MKCFQKICSLIKSLPVYLLTSNFISKLYLNHALNSLVIVGSINFDLALVMINSVKIVPKFVSFVLTNLSLINKLLIFIHLSNDIGALKDLVLSSFGYRTHQIRCTTTSLLWLFVDQLTFIQAQFLSIIFLMCLLSYLQFLLS